MPDGEFIDPEVLSALPPSVRLEVIGKMRDKRMADNREHFAAASGKMQDFSALQLQTYLKGTKIKRQIDEVMQRADVDDPMTANASPPETTEISSSPVRRATPIQRAGPIVSRYPRRRACRISRLVCSRRINSRRRVRDAAASATLVAPGTILGDQSPPDAADAVRREIRRRDTDHA